MERHASPLPSTNMTCWSSLKMLKVWKLLLPCLVCTTPSVLRLLSFPQTESSKTAHPPHEREVGLALRVRIHIEREGGAGAESARLLGSLPVVNAAAAGDDALVVPAGVVVAVAVIGAVLISQSKRRKKSQEYQRVRRCWDLR